MGSDHGCDCKGSREDALPGGGKGARWGQIMDAPANEAGTTHFLEVEKERDGSDHRCNCEGSKDNAHPRGGEGVRWRQIMNVTAKGARRTHILEVERECDGVRSWMRPQSEQGQRTFWK
jgi:hypothetical protein